MTAAPVSVEESPVAGPDAPARRSRASEVLFVIALYALSIGGALVISAILVTLTGGSPSQVLSSLMDGAFRAPGRWGNTLAAAVPLLLVALGTVIAYRSGLVNIGQEGQLLVGAAAAAFVGTRLAGPGVPILLLCILAGIAGGALWAAIPAGMKLRRVPEVISTLLLVTVAFQMTGYFVSNESLLLDRDPSRPNRVFTSPQLPEDARLPQLNLFGNEFPMSVVLALLLALGLAYVIARTVWGFRLRMLGSNPRTAQRVGVSSKGMGTLALVLSGAFAGLAGAFLFTGGHANYRFTPGFSSNFGWEGLLVALVARNHPLVAIPMALVFAGLRTGAGFLATTGVERTIVDIVQALMVLALLVPPAILFIRARRRALAAVRSRT